MVAYGWKAALHAPRRACQPQTMFGTALRCQKALPSPGGRRAMLRNCLAVGFGLAAFCHAEMARPAIKKLPSDASPLHEAEIAALLRSDLRIEGQTSVSARTLEYFRTDGTYENCTADPPLRARYGQDRDQLCVLVGSVTGCRRLYRTAGGAVYQEFIGPYVYPVQAVVILQGAAAAPGSCYAHVAPELQARPNGR